MISVRRSVGLLLLPVLALALGCGAKGVPTKVKVTMNGKALEGATVTFLDEATGYSASGGTDASGMADINGAKGAGVKTGTYKVTVAKSSGGSSMANIKPGTKEYDDMMKKGMAGGPAKSEVPDKYAAAATSGFTATVPSATPIEFDLKK